jgi:signal transduction histidine kinase
VTRRRKIAVSIYAFTAAISVAAVLALFFLHRVFASPQYLEPQAAWVQNSVDRLAQRDPQQLTDRMNRLASRLHGKLTLFDTSGRMVRSTSAALAPPSDHELAILRNEKWALSWGRIVVRNDESTMIGVYEPDDVGRPWGFLLVMCAGVLVVVGAASLWFSRRLVRPLGQLAQAARSFGIGNTAARAELHRDDELGDVGRAFDDMADRTAGVLIAQRQLMADVSHELRTPLARIRVALELAAEDPIAAKDLLSDIGTDLDEIDQLIEDILTTARLDVDHGRINKKPTRVDELASLAADRFASRHPGRVLERDIENAAIECDPLLLRRALDNLLDNAAKYSDPSTPIRLVAKPRNGHACFEVVDQGIGMTAEELEKAFTPFWRADGSRTRRTGGVGLGLALARRIARAHGGDITLASRPAQGTTATLELPL